MDIPYASFRGCSLNDDYVFIKTENNKQPDASVGSSDMKIIKRKVSSSLKEMRNEARVALAGLEELQAEMVAELVNNSEHDRKFVQVDDIALHQKDL